MAKKKQRAKPKTQRVLKKKVTSTGPKSRTPRAPKKKATGSRRKKTAVAKVKAPLEIAGAPEPTGSCRYADSFGKIQCESPVTKSYCDGKSGFFTEGGRC